MGPIHLFQRRCVALSTILAGRREDDRGNALSALPDLGPWPEQPALKLIYDFVVVDAMDFLTRVLGLGMPMTVTTCESDTDDDEDEDEAPELEVRHLSACEID